jgi:SAM-dependent methyltransferase
MPHTVAADVWASGAAYEPYIGRWSRLVARELIAWLDAPRGISWIDVGCGTGALTATLLDLASPRRVTALDASPGFAAYARATVGDDRVAFAVADARAIPLATGSADVAVSGLVLNFVSQPASAVAEMSRVTRSASTVSAYVWDYADGMQMLRRFWDAAVSLDPTAAALDEGRRFPMCEPSALDALWRGAGLHDVEVHAIEVPTRFETFDDFWHPFLGGQGPAPSYVATLDPAARARLRDTLRATLSARSPIDLTARAWAVRGRNP